MSSQKPENVNVIVVAPLSLALGHRKMVANVRLLAAATVGVALTVPVVIATEQSLLVYSY